MAEINGGELLARCLANEGIRFVFGLPRPEVDPLLATLDGKAISVRFVWKRTGEWNASSYCSA
jgi:acetolactate synthase-1/2/3 large subunit